MSANERLSANEESNILASIVAAVSLGALALVIAQMSSQLDATSTVVKPFGAMVAMATWASSILLLASSICRHAVAKKGYPVKNTDWVFYASITVVMLVLMAAMVWLAVSGLLAMSAKK
jgi:hypothetical protein